jgi:hypothetical protein
LQCRAGFLWHGIWAIIILGSLVPPPLLLVGVARTSLHQEMERHRQLNQPMLINELLANTPISSTEKNREIAALQQREVRVDI